MISLNNNIIARLPGNRVLVARNSSEQSDKLSKSEEETLRRLKQRDHEVKEHEAVHTRDPRLHTIGGTRYHYVKGPDGKMYAVGGEVTLSTGSTNNPKEAVEQARALKKASLEPGEPSPQDLAAASSASQMEAEALNKIHSNPYKDFLNKENKHTSALNILT